MQKGIGIGIEDFRQMIREDCYYFDKTNYIEELIKDKIIIMEKIRKNGSR